MADGEAGRVTRRVDGLAVYERAASPAPSPSGSPAPVVVFVHGSMDRGATFAKAGRHLDGFTLVRYDRRGYGRSVGAGVARSIEAHADDLLAVVGGRRCVVVGHSFGGVIALTAASRAPGSAAALGVFEAPMPWSDRWPHASAGGAASEVAGSEGPEAAAELFMRRMIGDERWETLPTGTRADRRAEGEALVAELGAMRDRTGPPYDLDAIGVPIVAGYGSAGKPYHRWAIEELARRARRSEVVVIDGAGHVAQGSHPVEFAAFVRRVHEAAVASAG